MREAHVRELGQIKQLRKKRAWGLVLASVAQLVGALSDNRKVAGWIPSQGTYLGGGFNPQVPIRVRALQSVVQVPTGSNQSMLPSHMGVSRSPFLSLSLTAMKKISSGED